MDILIKVLQFFMSLTILVAVHEFGHFIVARIFKIRVEKFYIFFDWGFSIWKKKFGDTEYGLGWLPLGGYCKIAGMVDESMDKEQLESAPQPWEYRAKPAWQRFLVLVAGVTMNLILAFCIYCGISFVYGKQYTANEDMIYGSEFSPNVKRLGFSDGDRIVSIDGEKIENYDVIWKKIYLAVGDCEVEVLRNGESHSFVMSYDLVNVIRKDDSAEKSWLYRPLIPFVVDSVISPNAIASGLQKGDRIVGVGEKDLPYFNQYAEHFEALKGQNAELKVLRGTEALTLNCAVDSLGKIGISVAPFPAAPRVREYNFFEAIPAGAKLAVEQLKDYWIQLGLIVRPDTGFYDKVGGFGSMGNAFSADWDWLRFWAVTAFFSIALAVMNIIPIPGLDGGHMIFTLWEMITRRKVSQRVLEIAQYIGMALILALVLYANGFDIYRFFFEK